MHKSVYSLGLYVHECPRMRYKAQFKGSQLLCNRTWKYFPIDSVRKQLDDHRNGLEIDENVIEQEKSQRSKSSMVCLWNSPVFVDLEKEDLTAISGYELFVLSETDENAQNACEKMLKYVGTLPTELKYIFVV